MTTDISSQQLSLAGIRIDALERRHLIQLVDRAKLTQDKLLILHHNLHSLYLHEADPSFSAAFREASCVYIDGLPIIWLGRMVGLPLTAANRITLLDSFETILDEAAQRGWRVYYLGSTEAVLTQALKVLRTRYPQLIIGGHNGFFLKEGRENAEIIEEINRFGADLLFVGMGMPIQEIWLAENKAKLSVSAILTSGGTLDYVIGTAYRPPPWAGKLGLYGIFRLSSDPKRLWRRYLIEPVILGKLISFRLIRQTLTNRASGTRGKQAVEEAFAETGSAGGPD